MLSTSLLALVLSATELHGMATLGVSGEADAQSRWRMSPFLQAQLSVSHEVGVLSVAARGAVVLALEGGTATSSPNLFVRARDLGSSLEVGMRLRRGWALRVRLFPLVSDRVLPSLDWANRWGSVPLNEFGPLLTVGLDTPTLDVWLGARPGLGRGEQELRWKQSMLAGARARLPERFVLDARAAFLDYGRSSSNPLSGVISRAFGVVADAALTWTWHEPVGPALDFVTYATDPTRFERFFAPQPSRRRFAAQLSLEGGFGAQWLPSASDNETRPQVAGFVDLQARVRLSALRFFATGRLRTASQVVFDGPSSPVGLRINAASQVPQVSGLFGADWSFPVGSTVLRPGLLVRVTRRASLEGVLFDPDGTRASVTAGQTTWGLKGSLVWQFSELGAFAFEAEPLGEIPQWTLLGQVRF